MSFIVKGSNTTRTPAPAGTHIARCIWMIDLGTHEDNFDGHTSSARKLVLGFELPTELRTFRPDEGARPVLICREFTTSLGKKANLRKFLEGWRGRAFTKEELEGFDLSVLAGKECMLNIIHKDKADGSTKAIIDSASRIMKGATCPPRVLPLISFNMADATFDIDTYNTLANGTATAWIVDKIRKSPEYIAATTRREPGDTTRDFVGAAEDEGIPF